MKFPEEIERAYQTWVRSIEGRQGKDPLHERRCMHYRREDEGRYYGGKDYLQRLQRLRGLEAMNEARKIGPFFWSDASFIKVWLCASCASGLGLEIDHVK